MFMLVVVYLTSSAELDLFVYLCLCWLLCISTPAHSPGSALALFPSLPLCFCQVDSSSLGCPYARQRAQPVPATNKNGYNEAGVAHRSLSGSCHYVMHKLPNYNRKSWVNTKANMFFLYWTGGICLPMLMLVVVYLRAPLNWRCSPMFMLVVVHLRALLNWRSLFTYVYFSCCLFQSSPELELFVYLYLHRLLCISELCWTGVVCLPMFMLLVVYLRVLLNWSRLFTYVHAGCCVSQSSAELQLFVYLYLCWLLCISELCWTGVVCLPIFMLVVVYLRALLNRGICLPMLMLVVVYLRALLNWSCLFTYVYVGCCLSQTSVELELFVCLPMLMLVVVYTRALLNWSCLFTYVYVSCCVFQSSAELELFVYLCLCWLLFISELCWTGVVFLFTYVYVGCCVYQSSAELELFVCLPIFMLVVVYLRALLNWSCLFTYVYIGCCESQSSAELELFVYLCWCWLLCISELCWTGVVCLPMFMLVVVYLRVLLNWSYLFTYVYIGCCLSQSSVELELFVYLCWCWLLCISELCWTGVVCLPMFMLVVVYLKALLNWSCLFVYLCLCWLLCISELYWTGGLCLFTYVDVGCCVSKGSDELELFVYLCLGWLLCISELFWTGVVFCLPMFMLVVVYLRALLNWRSMFVYLC